MTAGTALPAVVLAVFAAAAGSPAPAAADSRERPNVVLIVSDDQSFRDFGFLGNDRVRTPNLDRLASRSARFLRGYVPMSLCRASLATLVTGLYPHQHGIHFNHPPPGLSALRDLTAGKYHAARSVTDRFIRSVPTIPRVLAANGYAALQTGKWWEGHWSNGGFTHGMTTGRPSERREWLVGTRRQRNGEWVAHGNGDAGLTIGRESLQPVFSFVDEFAGRRPFFVWYVPFLPHTPYDAGPRFVAAALAAGAPPHMVGYYASIARFDETVGDLLDFLAGRELLESTLIIFVADNGSRPDPARPSRADLRSKASQYEDGLRTPILLFWAGRVEPGDHLSPVETIDVFPTILDAAGLSAEVTPRMRGRSLLPYASGSQDLPLIPVFGAIYPGDAFILGRPSHSFAARWVRYGDWKLVLHERRARAPGLPLEELYDLSADPRESTNLAVLSSTRPAPFLVPWLSSLIEWWWDPADL